MLRAETAQGRWTIAPRGDLFDVKYAAPYPEGHDYMTMRPVFESLGDDPETGFWVKEKQRIHAYASGSDLGFGASIFESQKLVQCLIEGDDGLPSIEEMLDALGFDPIYHHEESTTWYHRTRKALNLNIGKFGISAHYDGRTGKWYNLMRLDGFEYHGHNGKSVHYNFYPSTVKSPIKVGLHYMKWLIDQRGARDGRFPRPMV